MYLCYIDESGDPGPAGTRFLVLGAAVLFEGVWQHAHDDLEGLLDKHFPPPMPRPGEFHLAHIRSGAAPFYRGRPAAERDAIVDDLCALVAGYQPAELRFFAVAADKAAWLAANPGGTGDGLYAELFEQLCSRFDLYLRRRHADGQPSKGLVIADPHKPRLSAALRRDHVHFRKAGTRWARIYNLIETVLFFHSHESPGLQLADLCAYSCFRAFEAGDESYVRRLGSAFDREPLTSPRNPGKWHGIKYLGADPAVLAMVNAVWPTHA